MALARTRSMPAREPVRETPAAPSHGRVRIRQSTDKFHIPEHLIPEGWVYQWKRYSVLGQEDPQYLAELAQVGFTAVPADRHAGVFFPAGYQPKNNCIIIGGQILMERPIELEMEAQMEDRDRAVAQVRGSKEQFGLATRFDGPDSNLQARSVTGVRTSFERVDAPAPKHEIAID